MDRLGDLSKNTHTARQWQSRDQPLTPGSSSLPQSYPASQHFCSDPSPVHLLLPLVAPTEPTSLLRADSPTTSTQPLSTAKGRHPPILDGRPLTPALTCSHPELGFLRQPCLHSTSAHASPKVDPLGSCSGLPAVIVPLLVHCVPSLHPPRLVLSRHLPSASHHPSSCPNFTL